MGRRVRSGRHLPALLAALLLLGNVHLGDLSAGATGANGDEALAAGQARGIILFIGDGLGHGQRLAARWLSVGQAGRLQMEAMPFAGWEHTAAANAPITDSAAAATALATGVKTDIGAVGVGPGGRPLTTILERAHARGLAVGLVTSVELTDATPAAFAAHVPHRSMAAAIAVQMLAAGAEVLLGGGENDFLPTTERGCYPEAGRRADGRNLIDEALAAGYTYVCDAASFAAVDPESTPRLLGLFADEELEPGSAPSLAAMADLALQMLSRDPDGFLLVVEGGQIDDACHFNHAAEVMAATLRLDEAVAVARAYAASREDILVVVTADHETGGMGVALAPGGTLAQEGPFSMPDGTPFYVTWQSISHSPADVPVTAQGPWSDLLAGSHENVHVYEVMHLALTREHGWAERFDALSLAAPWTWRRQDAGSWSLAARPGFLRIRPQPGSLRGPGGDAANLLLQPAPPGDFEIRTRLLLTPTSDLQFAGLLVYGDDDHYVLFARQGDGLVLESEVGGLTSTVHASAAWTAGYLRLEQAGQWYNAAYSVDGAAWTTMGSQVNGALARARIGLVAADPSAAPDGGAADFGFFWVIPRSHRVLLPLVISSQP